MAQQRLGEIPSAISGMMQGKRGLVMGVANDHSIAWLVARWLHAAGAEIVFSCQNDMFHGRLEKLTANMANTSIIKVDVSSSEDMQQLPERIGDLEKGIDFVVHAIAWSDKDELRNRYVDTTRQNFIDTLTISCYSFTETVKVLEPHLNSGASLLTMSYKGSTRVIPNYNVMGVAKAALETSVRYLANDLGAQNIRVNAMSPGPMRTIAAAAIGGGRFTYSWQADHAPMLRAVDDGDVGGAALYLLSDMSAGTTGEVHSVDCGYEVIGMVNSNSPMLQNLSESD